MNAFRPSLIAISFLAILVLGACAPAPTPIPTAAPPTAAPIQPAATATTAPTAVPATATRAPTTAPTPTAPGAASITITLGPGRDGDQTPATAVLTSQGAKTEVVLNVRPGAVGVQQPAHIHEGACPNVGAVKFPLTNVQEGKSITVVDAALKDLLTGTYSINVHESTSNAGKYVACGGIPKGTVFNFDKGRDGDQTPGTAVLISAGAKTDVYLSIKPAAAGISQPVHIHDGSCPGVGAVKFPLTNIVDGKSKTTVDVSLDDLLQGSFAINAHESTANAGKYVACTVIGQGKPAAQPTDKPGGYKYP